MKEYKAIAIFEGVLILYLLIAIYGISPTPKTIYVDRNITTNICDCSAQEKLNILLLERCKGK